VFRLSRGRLRRVWRPFSRSRGSGGPSSRRDSIHQNGGDMESMIFKWASQVTLPRLDSNLGVRHGPPNVLAAPKPTSSSSTISTFGAPSGGSKGSIGGTRCPGPWRHRSSDRTRAGRGWATSCVHVGRDSWVPPEGRLEGSAAPSRGPVRPDWPQSLAGRGERAPDRCRLRWHKRAMPAAATPHPSRVRSS
jgi:hypothetical protein